MFLALRRGKPRSTHLCTVNTLLSLNILGHMLISNESFEINNELNHRKQICFTICTTVVDTPGEHLEQDSPNTIVLTIHLSKIQQPLGHNFTVPFSSCGSITTVKQHEASSSMFVVICYQSLTNKNSCRLPSTLRCLPYPLKSTQLETHTRNEEYKNVKFELASVQYAPEGVDLKFQLYA